MSLKFGVLWPFRNPSFARVPWDDFYRSHLDLVCDSEAMGYDNAWLTEHHFVNDGYSPSLLPIGAAIATLGAPMTRAILAKLPRGIRSHLEA